MVVGRVPYIVGLYIYTWYIYRLTHTLSGFRPFWFKAKPGDQLENPTHRPKLVNRDDEYRDPPYPLIPDLQGRVKSGSIPRGGAVPPPGLRGLTSAAFE